MLFSSRTKTAPITADGALAGRDHYIYEVPNRHEVLHNPLQPPFPEHLETAIFALGCFWGAERLFWRMDGVWTTAAVYTGAIRLTQPIGRPVPDLPGTPKPFW